MPDPAMAKVGILREVAVHGSHETRQVRSRCLNHVVIVISQLAAREYADLIALDRFAKDLDKSETVLVILEEIALPVSSSHDVIDPICNIQAASFGHSELSYNPGA